MPTRNLGQVSGLWIGTTAPTNTDLIWLDTSLNPAVHKIYANGGWIDLAPQVISTISYTNLKTLAQNPGLAVGSWYQITDTGTAYRNGVLALAITSNRIHYVANNGNVIIDDLSSNQLAEFRLPCVNNLLIDGITGDWVNNQLNFDFGETTPSNASDYFVFGKRLISGVFKLAKFKIANFISAVAGNDLTWNQGLYVNLNNLLNARYDQSGGVVAYNTYLSQMTIITAALNQLSEHFQSLIGPYIDGGGVQHPDGIIDEKIKDTYVHFERYFLPSNFTPQQHVITPGTSSVQDWMENADYYIKDLGKYDLIIEPDSSLPYCGLEALDDANINSNIKSVLIKRGVYKVLLSEEATSSSAISVSKLNQNNAIIQFEAGVEIECSYDTNSQYPVSTTTFWLFDNELSYKQGNSIWNFNNAVIKKDNNYSNIKVQIFTGEFGAIKDIQCVDYANKIGFCVQAWNVCNIINGYFEDCNTVLAIGIIEKCYGKFDNCYSLFHCLGEFSNCQGMIMNRMTGSYVNCVTEIGGSTPVANTAAGGWNY